MNAAEFEAGTRLLLQLLATACALPKESAERKQAWMEYDRQEKRMQEVVDITIARRERNKATESEREEFFLLVADLLKERRAMRNRKSTDMRRVWDVTKKVREYLSKWEKERKEAKKKELENMQYKLEL